MYYFLDLDLAFLAFLAGVAFSAFLGSFLGVGAPRFFDLGMISASLSSPLSASLTVAFLTFLGVAFLSFLGVAFFPFLGVAFLLFLAGAGFLGVACIVGG